MVLVIELSMSHRMLRGEVTTRVILAFTARLRRDELQRGPEREGT